MSILTVSWSKYTSNLKNKPEVLYIYIYIKMFGLFDRLTRGPDKSTRAKPECTYRPRGRHERFESTVKVLENAGKKRTKEWSRASH
jgi:hypothetical protein